MIAASQELEMRPSSSETMKWAHFNSWVSFAAEPMDGESKYANIPDAAIKCREIIRHPPWAIALITSSTA